MDRVGPYRVLGVVGRGGAGQVLRVANPRGGPDLALKLLTQRPSPRALRRFRTEAEALVRVQHPGVVQLHDAGEHEGEPYLVMDLVEGESLQSRLDRGGALAWGEAAALVQQLAETLAECHALGVVHRDLKPDNVLLDAQGRARLVDFGLALDLDATHTRLTRSGASLGTPGYWAPEQARGDRQAQGPPIDVYGLGALLYATLTRLPPFRGTSLGEALSQTLDAAPESPRVHAPDVPSALEQICLRCLEKDPAQRYPSAHAVALALRELLREPASPPARSGSGLWTVLGVVGVLLGAVATWALTRPAPVRAPLPSVEDAPEPLPQQAEPPLAPVAPSVAELIEAREFRAALPLLDQALVADPADLLARTQRGLVRRHLKEFEAALLDLNRVIEARPADAFARSERGATLRKLGEDDRARADLDEALSLDPTLSGAFYHRGALRRKAGNLEGALADLNESLRLKPDVAHALYHRARVNMDLGENGAALKDLSRVLELVPSDDDALMLRSDVLRLLGRSEDALLDLDAAVAANPTNPDCYARRGFLRSMLQGREAGLDDLRRCLQLEPSPELAAEIRAYLQSE